MLKFRCLNLLLLNLAAWLRTRDEGAKDNRLCSIEYWLNACKQKPKMPPESIVFSPLSASFHPIAEPETPSEDVSALLLLLRKFGNFAWSGPKSQLSASAAISYVVRRQNHPVILSPETPLQRPFFGLFTLPPNV